MPNIVFKDSNLEKEFNEKGYVKVPFLSGEEIEYLKKKFFDTIEESGGPKTSDNVDYESKGEISYDFTFIDKNTEYKQKVFDIITSKFQAKADQYLNGYTPIIANYIRKKQDGGEVPMHQNWAFVDEEKYTSVSIWVPLVDSNEENGTLQMVNGSHKRFGKYRGPMVPWELRHVTKEIIKNNLTPMNVKAGEGVILDDSIVHYSNINKTPGLRLAIQLIMIPKETTSVHYHLDRDKDPNKITVLETDVNFYTHFHPWLKPEGRKEIKTLSYKEQNFTYQNFLDGLKEERFDQKLVHQEQKTIAPLFKDAKVQILFEEEGFVKIPLLNKQEVEDLKNYYLSLKHDHIGEYGFHVSLDNTNPEYISGVFKKLFETIMPKLDPLLHDYKTFTASYVVKEAGLQNIVPPHQDWSFVDEEQYCSATVWIPLMDVNKNNGALGLIKGSHKLFSYPRSSPSPQSKTVLSDHMFNLFPYIEVIDMKAGEALIFNNKTIHASPPNISGITRLGAGIGITQKDAQLLHYYQQPGKEELIKVFKVDELFFIQNNNSKLSKLYAKNEAPKNLELIKSFKKTTPVLSREEMISIVTSVEGVNFNTELMTELAEMYNYNLDGTPKNKTQTTMENKPNVENTKKEADARKTKSETTVLDNRTFFQKYTPLNILAEVKYRLTKK